jgi:hypothetical protein
MIRIYADFNNVAEDGKVELNTVGSLRDIAANSAELREGLRVMLYMTDEFDVEAVLCFDRIWLGVPDYTTLVYTDGLDEPQPEQ